MKSLNRFWDSIRFALYEMNSNGMRTFLSLFGITIGIFCIIMVQTLIDSLKSNISNSLSELGNDVVYVSRFSWLPEDNGEYPFWKYIARPTNTFKEYQLLKSELRDYKSLAILFSNYAQNISFNGNSVDIATVFGATQDFADIQSIQIYKGRYFTEAESEGIRPVVILGYNVYEAFAANQRKVMDEYMNLNNHPLRIIGVLEKKGESMTGFDFDNSVIVSYLLGNQIFNVENSNINDVVDPLIMVKAKNADRMDELEGNITSILRKERQIRPTEENSFSFNRLSTLQKSVDSIFLSINLAGYIIGIFSLIIGIFGIANIMFVSVKERTPQIGLKKAIGAKSSDILIEFISEAIILCLIGGLAGLVLIFFISKIISSYSDFEISMSASNFIIGMSISLIAGFLAGIIPASSAARMHPVDAIRYR